MTAHNPKPYLRTGKTHRSLGVRVILLPNGPRQRGAQIVMFAFQANEPGLLFSTTQFCRRVFGEFQVERQMEGGYMLILAGCDQFLAGVLPNCFQHSVSRCLAFGLLIYDNQRLVYEMQEQIENVIRFYSITSTNFFSRW